jgi:hypothetical protein
MTTFKEALERTLELKEALEATGRKYSKEKYEIIVNPNTYSIYLKSQQGVCSNIGYSEISVGNRSDENGDTQMMAKADVAKRLWLSGKTRREIEIDLNVNRGTLSSWANRQDFPKRKPGRPISVGNRSNENERKLRK